MTDTVLPKEDGEIARIFHYHHHPRAVAHMEGKAAKPAKVRDQLRTDTALHRFNNRVGLAVTLGVGTMWAAYVFTLLALVSLPAVLTEVSPKTFDSVFPHWLVATSLIALVAWVAQTFLQLVLLPIIIVGQNLQAKASDKRAENTYEDAEAVLHEAMQIQQHLASQDRVLTDLIARLEALQGSAGTS